MIFAPTASSTWRQRLKRSSTNIEFLRQVQAKTPSPEDVDA